MKFQSRPINWSLVLVPLLFSALAIPGNAYSQQRDRVSNQQEHKRRAGAIERSGRKPERTVSAYETRQRPTAAPKRQNRTRSAPARKAAATPRTSSRTATSRSQQQRRASNRTRSNTARPPVARQQRTPVRTKPVTQPRSDRIREARTRRDTTRSRSQQRAVSNTPPRKPPAHRGTQSRPTGDRRPASTPGQQQRSRNNVTSRRPQGTRSPGNRNTHNRGRSSQTHRRPPDRYQERRIRAERQQANRYFASQARQRDRAAQRARMLQQQRRANQYRYQNQYRQRLQRQHVRWNSGNYNYYNDPFYSTPANYRYRFSGQWHTTNRYGADLMQRAVDQGYQEGRRAGQADRQDGWRADYGNSFAYQDASYGYNGRYISPAEYQHYFRQGFQRGYQDGYADRYQYGYRQNDGSVAVVAAVLATIVGLQLLN